MKNKYSKKEHIEEFMFGLQRAYNFTEPQSNHSFPKELAQFRQPILDLLIRVGDIEKKYFQKQWDKEDEEEAI